MVYLKPGGTGTICMSLLFFVVCFFFYFFHFLEQLNLLQRTIDNLGLTNNRKAFSPVSDSGQLQGL